MTNWKEYTFEELFKIPLRNGLNKPSKVRGAGYRMINMKEIFGYDFIDDSTPMELVPLSEREKENSFLQEGDLLFARQSLIASGAGKISIYRGSLPTVFESHLIRCRIDNKIALSKYVYYLVKSPYGRGKIETIVTQTAAAGIRGSELKNLKFNLPDLPTQTAIAEILSSLDDKIELNNKINQELENLAQTLFKQWFIDFEFPNQNGEPYKSSGGEMVDSELGEIPKGWEVKKVDEVTEISSSKRIFSKEYVETGVPFFRGKEITELDRSNKISTELFISYERYNDIKSKFGVPKIGDILITSVGTIGNTYLINYEFDFYFKDGNITWIKNYTSHLSPYFIFTWLRSNETQSNIKKVCIGSTQQALTITALNNLKIIFPSKVLSTEFSSVIESMYNQISSNKNENQELTNLRDTLLPKLISGELEVNNHNF
jgi:type I restriction enzyme S subunit